MRNKYSFSEFFGTAWALFITKLYYRPARLIRRPIYMRGKRSAFLGKGLTTGHACRFDLPGKNKTLFIGKNCEFGDNVHIVAHKSVRLGDNVLIASNVFISDTSHGLYKGEQQDSPAISPNERKLVSQEVVIGDNVWIGENVVVLPGATIGDGCIIGANAVVNSVLEKNTIAVGVSAKSIKKYNSEKGIWEKIDGEQDAHINNNT